MAKAELSTGGFITRWPGDDLPLTALAGVVLLIAYMISLRSTWRATSWSHIRRRMSGQVDVDEIDRN
jgi:hypothetical protein